MNKYLLKIEKRINYEIKNLVVLSIFRLVLLIILFSPKFTKAQDIDETNKIKKKDVDYKTYFMPSVSFVSSNYRDFATSPLYYKGMGINLDFAWSWQKTKWEYLFSTNFSFSLCSAQTPESAYFQASTSANFIKAEVYSHYLRKIEKFSTKKIDFKIGGAVLSTLNMRINSDLQNNGFGLESIDNLMFSTKINKNISRTIDKQLNLWFVKKSLKPVERYLSFQLNIGIINLNYRPGYSYFYDPEVDGSNYSALKYITANHVWKMNGYRFETRLEYCKYSANRNGHKWAYIWDITSAPGRYETFQMATHRIQYTIIINSL